MKWGMQEAKRTNVDVFRIVDESQLVSESHPVQEEHKKNQFLLKSCIENVYRIRITIYCS